MYPGRRFVQVIPVLIGVAGDGCVHRAPQPVIYNRGHLPIMEETAERFVARDGMSAARLIGPQPDGEAGG